MAEFKIIRIQVARDSAADWSSNNPTLHSGEFGYEEDTGKLKIGDGSTAWNSLGYLDSGSGGGGFTEEEIEDIVNGLISAGNGITKTYNDAGNTLTIALTGESYTTAEQLKLSNIEDGAQVNPDDAEIVLSIDAQLGSTNWQNPLTQEQVQDFMASALTGGSQTNISVTYNDAGNVFDFFVSGGGGSGLTEEEVEDLVAGFIINGTGLSKVYDDVTGQLTLSLSNEIFTISEKNKLAAIESGATADQSAADVPLTDAGGYYSSINVEAALQEIFPLKAGLADENTFTDANHFTNVATVGDNGLFLGEDEGTSGVRWRLTKEQSSESLEFSTQNSAGSSYSGAYTIRYTLNDSGTPADNTDLLTKAYADSTYGEGNVATVGTPVDNQLGVWTGDGTLEGTSALTFDGTDLDITGNITLSGTVDGRDIAVDGAITDLAIVSDITGIPGASTVNNFISVTQTEYDAIISPDANTVYYIEDAPDYRYVTLYLSGATEDIEVGTDKGRTYCPYTGTITNIVGVIATAPTDASAIFDVNLNGSTIMTTDKIEIESGEFSSETATTSPALTTTAVTAGDILTADITQIGSTIAGSGFAQVIIEIDVNNV